MNTLSAIVTALLAALAVDAGTFDLSGSDQVKEGTFVANPLSVAFACLTPPELVESTPETRDEWYLETFQTEVRLWVPFTADTTGNRAARGRLVADEVKALLDNARANVGSALWRCVYFRTATVDPDPANATASHSWVHTTLTVEFTFRRLVGTGA